MPRKPNTNLDLKCVKSDDVPASVGLVKAVRKELLSEIRGSEHRLTSQIQETLKSVHRTQVLMEEQRSENRIVLDGIQTLAQRQDRTETEMGELRTLVKAFVGRTV